MKHRTRDEHLFGPGPKRILALDGGGIRGILTLAYLKRLEDILRQRVGGDEDFRLCDYFDLIGGTSTGSIIATGLALGFPVEKLQAIYRNLANEVFQKPFWRFGVLSAKFPQEPLVEALTEHFSDYVLGCDELQTGLMIMAKRLDTGSPWVIHNNPKGKYFNSADGITIANREFLLRQMVRASTAAPHYFQPEPVMVRRGLEGAFVDGGVSTANNPALQLFMLATIKGYGLNWPLGADNLLLVSVGTGTGMLNLGAEKVLGMPAVEVAVQALTSIMADCDWLGQTLLQWMSRSPTAWRIDSEIGDLSGDTLGDRELLSYLRYNVVFNSTWLKEKLDLELDPIKAAGLEAMDNPENVDELEEVGVAAASIQVKEAHFAPVFDITSD